MIDIDALVVRYPGDRPPAVDGLTFTVPEGRFCGFLGPNGAGKSTTLAALMGLVRRTSGRATVAGIDPQAEPDRLRAVVGYVPQAIALHATLGVRENLVILGGLAGLSGRVLHERVARAIHDARLEGRERSRVGALSGGMQRRLNLVASLMHEPRLILCDEPTAGVDPQSRTFIHHMLRGLNAAGRTILYTTHHMEEVEALCSHVAIVDRGRLVAQGALADVLAGRSLEDVFLSLTGHALRDDEE
ncbi:MAG: ABC transporter ATP-binding protein [Deltaproteobacteria bacterium]|nr:ABC transporter ATP-binding protein [Deltaproteobacteria bacterium]